MFIGVFEYPPGSGILLGHKAFHEALKRGGASREIMPNRESLSTMSTVVRWITNEEEATAGDSTSDCELGKDLSAQSKRVAECVPPITPVMKDAARKCNKAFFTFLEMVSYLSDWPNELAEEVMGGEMPDAFKVVDRYTRQ